MGQVERKQIGLIPNFLINIYLHVKPKRDADVQCDPPLRRRGHSYVYNLLMYNPLTRLSRRPPLEWESMYAPYLNNE
jgi:hypothetical protein